MKIALTSVSVNDPVAAHQFYTEKLGFSSKMFVPEAYLAIVVSPEEPNGTAILLEPRGNLGSRAFFDGIYNAGMPVIVFGTDDIQKEYERLKERGVTFKKEPTKTDWGIEAVFDDTCGNYIQLAQIEQ
ncbi:MAG TPA: VOC family protein [Rhodothermales bacterium]|nr:VOC family protein [Rhodothermales bacterium]